MKHYGKTLILLSVFLIFVSRGIIYSQSSEEEADTLGLDFDSTMMTILPGGSFFTSYLENFSAETTSLIEESNGFALMDNPRIYFEGDSYLNFNWYYNGLNINSVLNAGTPGFMIPFSLISGFSVPGERPDTVGYGFNYHSNPKRMNRSSMTISSIYSNLGSYSPWAKFLISTPAIDRAEMLYTERRKMTGNYFLDCSMGKSTKKTDFILSISYLNMTRQFNDFNEFNSVYEESGSVFSTGTNFTIKSANATIDLVGFFNYSTRSNLNSETGTLPQETLDTRRYAFLTGIVYKTRNLHINAYLQVEDENRKPFEQNYVKELLDNDGDGFAPYDRMGKYRGIGLNANLDYFNTIRVFGIESSLNGFLRFRHVQIRGDEQINQYNPILVQNQPYQVVLWDRGHKYNNSNTNITGGVVVTTPLSRDISVISKLLFQYTRLGFDFSNNNLEFLRPGIDLGVHLFKNRRTSLVLSYGILPYAIRENTNFFLESGRPSGTIHQWNDINNDRVFQYGEEGSVFGYSGGQHHFKSEDLSAPYYHRLLLELNTKISDRWTFHAKALYKQFKKNFVVRFAEAYGFYESVENKELFFFDRPFEDYYLTNSDFQKDSFYAQLLLAIKGRVSKRWFFSFSLLTHIGMGHTSFGNGAGSNDIGVLSESQANPNSWVNNFGRVDGDRAFVIKGYTGFHLTRNVTLGISLKYRDGAPFAFIDHYFKYGQVAMTYATIKALDEKGKGGGPREDYLSDISVRLNYYFRIFNRDAILGLSWFNVIDVGYELSEYVFSGGTRLPNELHIPRSIRLSLKINW